jgi:opacity protein-like surface antigen
MKTFLILSICFTLTIARAQTLDTTAHSKFDFGFSFSPDYNYRVLSASNDNGWAKNFYDTLEVPKYGYTCGFNVVYNFNEHFNLGSGILFSDKGERTKKYVIQPVNNYINHYYYLDVPIRANYYLTISKVKLYASAGINANIFLGTESSVSTGNSGEKNNFGSSSAMSRFALSFIGGVGMDCHLTDRWYVKIEPLYRRFFMSANNDAGLKKYFYSFGLNIGIYCHI